MQASDFAKVTMAVYIAYIYCMQKMKQQQYTLASNLWEQYVDRYLTQAKIGNMYITCKACLHAAQSIALSVTVRA
jgi:hypothetical protein